MHRELAALKGVALTAKTRAQLNKDMCLTHKYADGKLLADDAVLLPMASSNGFFQWPYSSLDGIKALRQYSRKRNNKTEIVGVL